MRQLLAAFGACWEGVSDQSVKQSNTYYAEHQCTASEDIHLREACPATHTVTLGFSWISCGTGKSRACLQIYTLSSTLRPLTSHCAPSLTATLPLILNITAQSRQEITDAFFQPMYLLREGRHSQASQDIPVDLVAPAIRPDQENPWDQQVPCGPCPLSFLQAPCGLSHLSFQSGDTGGIREEEKKLTKEEINHFYCYWRIRIIIYLLRNIPRYCLSSVGRHMCNVFLYSELFSILRVYSFFIFPKPRAVWRPVCLLRRKFPNNNCTAVNQIVQQDIKRVNIKMNLSSDDVLHMWRRLDLHILWSAHSSL